MKSQKGVTLIEIVIAMVVLGIISVGFFSAINNSTETLITVDERETGRNLAESQMEYVKERIYAWSYTPAVIPSAYTGYTASIMTEELTDRDTNIQKIIVTIQHRGRDVATLIGYKTR